MTMGLTRPPVAKAEMLIHKTPDQVFEAFVDPAITSKFWFSKGSGKLEPGKQLRWDWQMYDFSVQVDVKVVERARRIVITWSAYGAPTTIEWLFSSHGNDATFVTITNNGFVGDGDSVVEQAISSTEGFSFVLAGAKALLEHGVLLNLVPDRHPKGLSVLRSG